MNLFKEIRDKLEVIVYDKLGLDSCDGVCFSTVTVEPPRDLSHGDMSTNVAMVLAKKFKMNPRQLAEKCAEYLRLIDGVDFVDVAGPGFINIKFIPAFWQKELIEILKDGVGYGNNSVGLGKNINLEYVSANPTGPLHIGHARGAVVGDALALLLLKSGFNVTKEYYVNDAGSQVNVLAESAYLRYREACGEVISIADGLYPGEYLKSVGSALLDIYGDDLLNKDKSEWLPLVKEFALESMMVMIKQDLADLGVVHDVFTSEKSLHDDDRINKILNKMKAMGLVYKGILEPPKGKVLDDWESREQLLFKSTDYGDDVDRALAKSDGSWTYFAADTAYVDEKIKRGFDSLIMILGADHGGYVKRMKAIVKAIGEDEVSLDIQLCQLVKFMDNGVPIKMSKRSGSFTTVSDVIDAVGKDVIRFIMLTRKPEQSLDFDLAKVTEQSRDNPVFYVQYAHARCKSLLRMAIEQLPNAVKLSEVPSVEQLSYLSLPIELQIIKTLASWPRVVESAALSYEPHRIAYYLLELAAAFHGFWNAGNAEAGLRVVVEGDEELTVARLVLARAVATVIASGLQILGVEPKDEMR